MNTLATPLVQSPILKPIPCTSSADSTGTVDRFYRPELDMLRFFAFVSVFLYHGLPGFVTTRHSGVAAQAALYETTIKGAGRFGVCLFFLLSAYLITELLGREKANTGTIHVGSFYSRRILRIWPLYFAFLFAGVLLGLAIQDYRLEAHRIAAFLLLAGNWYVARIGCSANPIAPLWSISVEEQFYLAWPWVVKLGGRTWTCITCLILLPLSFLFLYELSRAGADAGSNIWFNSFVQFQFFALGALLALCLRGRVPALGLPSRIAIFVAGLTSWLIADGVLRLGGADVKTVIRFDCRRLCICRHRLLAVLRQLPRNVDSLGAKTVGLSRQDFVRSICISHAGTECLLEAVLACREPEIIASGDIVEWSRFGSPRCSDSAGLYGHDGDLRGTVLPIP